MLWACQRAGERLHSSPKRITFVQWAPFAFTLPLFISAGITYAINIIDGFNGLDRYVWTSDRITMTGRKNDPLNSDGQHKAASRHEMQFGCIALSLAAVLWWNSAKVLTYFRFVFLEVYVGIARASSEAEPALDGVPPHALKASARDSVLVDKLLQHAAAF